MHVFPNPVTYGFYTSEVGDTHTWVLQFVNPIAQPLCEIFSTLQGCKHFAQIAQPCDNLVTTLQSYSKGATT